MVLSKLPLAEEKCCGSGEIRHKKYANNDPSDRMSLTQVFTKLETNDAVHNPYYVMCKHLILDNMEGLLEAAKRWLAEGPAPHLLRCLTHLLIVLRKIYRIVEPVQENTANAVLLACVKVAMTLCGRSLTGF